MPTIDFERNKMFQFLMQNQGKKYAVGEIARGVGITISLALSESYERIRRELNQMVEHGIIESTIDDGDIKYFVTGR